ncbi:MAG: DUF4190 domain-containing protein [Actinomycetota bacterium]
MSTRVCPSYETIAPNPWAKFCTKCGGALPEAQAAVTTPPAPWPPQGAWVAPPSGYPPPGYPPPGYIPPWYMPRPKTPGTAVASLIFGIVSFFVWFLGIFTAPPAIIMGVLGRRKSVDDPVRWGGKALATTGLVLGLVWMVLATLVISLMVFGRLASR